MDRTIFSAADICLPPYAAEDPLWQKWSVIACDQFTSEPDYWERVEKEVGDAPSAYHLMLPEAYLKTPQESEHGKKIPDFMNRLDGWTRVLQNRLVYLERTLPDGKIRRGLIGKLDLEAYEYHAGSLSFVRATEATVLERIPPRCAIREAAPYEMPHVMVFYTDPEDMILEPVRAEKDFLQCLYRSRLMEGGGAAAGYELSGKKLESVLERIAHYEEKRRQEGGVGYAVGDGNHSLAAAKAHYENKKKQLGSEALHHPSRYALVELVRLEEESIQFEPIYRLVTGCDTEDLFAALESVTEPESGGQSVTAVTAAGKKTFSFCAPPHSLTVGTLQEFLDAYMRTHPSVQCDYIHGKNTLFELTKKSGCAGFLFDGMEKDALFPYVEQGNVLPRKTFSMGEARSKRYYLELRKIQ